MSMHVFPLIWLVSGQNQMKIKWLSGKQLCGVIYRLKCFHKLAAILSNLSKLEQDNRLSGMMYLSYHWLI